MVTLDFLSSYRYTDYDIEGITIGSNWLAMEGFFLYKLMAQLLKRAAVHFSLQFFH
jgi:hypothetical protein